MRLQVKGRHIDVTDSLFQYAEKKLGKLARATGAEELAAPLHRRHELPRQAHARPDVVAGERELLGSHHRGLHSPCLHRSRRRQIGRAHV